jgi:hypothetical protein
MVGSQFHGLKRLLFRDIDGTQTVLQFGEFELSDKLCALRARASPNTGTDAIADEVKE